VKAHSLTSTHIDKKRKEKKRKLCSGCDLNRDQQKREAKVSFCPD
jgi:hypothetical protein